MVVTAPRWPVHYPVILTMKSKTTAKTTKKTQAGKAAAKVKRRSVPRGRLSRIERPPNAAAADMSGATDHPTPGTNRTRCKTAKPAGLADLRRSWPPLAFDTCRERRQALPLLHLLAFGHRRTGQGACCVSDPGSSSGAGCRRQVCALLGDGTAVFCIVSSTTATTEQCRELVAQAAALARSLASRSGRTASLSCRSGEARRNPPTGQHDDGPSDANDSCGAETITPSIPIKLQRIGKGTQFLVSASTVGTAKPNGSLIRLLLLAAATAGQSQSTYPTLLLRLSWLVPDITQAILQ
jgi:hypothetical protein